MNWCDGQSNPKILQPILQRFSHGAVLKIEPKVSDLNIAFNRFASVGTVMHYILVISEPLTRDTRKGI